LHAAHETTDERGAPLEIVHRDVSPQNILVGVDGVARITDFGVAKARGRLLTTRDGSLKGKLAYMAPEQLRGGNVTRQADVCSVAVVLWEVLAGERLFRSTNEGEVVQRILFDDVPPPSTRASGLAGSLDAIVLRGLARESSARYASALEMATALERCGIPAASPREVAAWVEAHCDESLFQRGQAVARIEHSASASEDVRSAIGVRPVARAVLDSALPTVDAPTPARSPRRAWLVAVSIGALALLGLLAMTFARGGARSQNTDVSAASPASAVASIAASAASSASDPVATVTAASTPEPPSSAGTSEGKASAPPAAGRTSAGEGVAASVVP
jgi:serine/threonine-protein kinase